MFSAAPTRVAMSEIVQLAHVRLGAQIRRHAAKNDFVDAALAQLQDKVIGFRPVHLVRTRYDGCAVIDVLLVLLKPVGA